MDTGRCTDSKRSARVSGIASYGYLMVSLIILMTSIIALLMLVLILGIGPLGDASAAPPDQVVHHEVRIENLTHFIMNSTIELHSYEGVNASAIRQQYDAAFSDNKTAMISGMQDSAVNETMTVLRTMFNGSYEFHSMVEIELTSLDIGLGPDVPVTLWANSSADLSRDSYDLPPEAILEDVVFGTLNMGAVVKLDVELTAPSNSTATYVFYPPPGTLIEEHTTGMHGQNNVTWVLDNTEGFASYLHEYLRMKSEFPNRVTDEDVRVTLVLDRKEFELTTVHVDIEVYSVEVARYGNLSKNIASLKYITADGIRMVVRNGLHNWTWERIYQETILSNEEEIEAALKEALNVTVDMNFSWDNITMEGYVVDTMGTVPPIHAWLTSDDLTPHLYAIGNDSYGIEDIKLAKGFLNAGGKAEFDIPEIGLDLWVSPTAKLILSPNMRLENFTGSEHLETDNRYSYTWDPNEQFHGRITSLKAKTYNGSRIEVDVTVDFKEIDANWFDLMDTRANIDVSGDLDFYRIETPEEIEEALPEGMTIDYIISDVLRLAYDTGLIDLGDINDIIENRTEEIEEELKDSLEENIFLSIRIREETLQGYDVNSMSGELPVSIRGVAQISIPLAEGMGGDESNLLQGNFFYYVFREFSFDFSLDPLEDWKITYTMILPRGIVITEVSDDLGLAEKGTTGGRHYISLTIGEQENNLTVTIGITPMFFINICMLPIAIILVIVVLLISRRRARKKRKREKERREQEEMMRTPGSFYQLQQLKGRLKDLEEEKSKIEKAETKEEKKKRKQEEKKKSRREMEKERQGEGTNGEDDGIDESGSLNEPRALSSPDPPPKPLIQDNKGFAPPPPSPLPPPPTLPQLSPLPPPPTLPQLSPLPPPPPQSPSSPLSPPTPLTPTTFHAPETPPPPFPGESPESITGSTESTSD